MGIPFDQYQDILMRLMRTRQTGTNKLIVNDHIKQPCLPAVAVLSEGSAAKLEHGSGDESLEKAQAEARHPGVILVHVISYRRRLLDTDNLCEKYHVDCLRYAQIIPDDAPEIVATQVSQKKVSSKDDERTEFIITKPQ